MYKLINVLLHTTYHCTLYKHKSRFTCSSTLTYYCTIYIVHHCTVHSTVHICTPTHVHSSLFILFNNFMPTYLSYLNFGTLTKLARKAAVLTLWTNLDRAVAAVFTHEKLSQLTPNNCQVAVKTCPQA